MALHEVVDEVRQLIFKNTGIRTLWEGFKDKRPPDTYMTIEILEPYLPVGEQKEFKYQPTSNTLDRHTKDTYESLLQFKIYGKDEASCIIAFSKLKKYAVYRFRMDLIKLNVAYVDMSGLRGLINFDEDDKEVIKTFDLKIRLTEDIVDEVDYFDKGVIGVGTPINKIEVNFERK
ncbi:MAG: phage neck terminator protein [Cellulosilyticaceae bacterium]